MEKMFLKYIVISEYEVEGFFPTVKLAKDYVKEMGVKNPKIYKLAGIKNYAEAEDDRFKTKK